MIQIFQFTPEDNSPIDNIQRKGSNKSTVCDASRGFLWFIGLLILLWTGFIIEGNDSKSVIVTAKNGPSLRQ